jgi:hypothetical protein
MIEPSLTVGLVPRIATRLVATHKCPPTGLRGRSLDLLGAFFPLRPGTIHEDTPNCTNKRLSVRVFRGLFYLATEAYKQSAVNGVFHTEAMWIPTVRMTLSNPILNGSKNRRVRLMNYPATREEHKKSPSNEKRFASFPKR